MFLSLTKEIEAQGVARKVVADMFGLALRGYQRKTQRLAQSSSVQGKTLFEAILEFVEREGGAARSQVLQRFRSDGEREAVGVLTDLVQSGLLHATGCGEQTFYGVTSEAERQRFVSQCEPAAMCNMLLAEIYRNPGIDEETLRARYTLPAEDLGSALATLVREGRARPEEHGLGYVAPTFQLGPDEPGGWEIAVFDHFQAVASAIGKKLQLMTQPSADSAWVGGSTLRFELHSEHPLKDQVLDLLASTRSRIEALWEQVGFYNDAHPHPERERAILTFYFGQNLDDPSLLRTPPVEAEKEAT
jgi:hypothetical protein